MIEKSALIHILSASLAATANSVSKLDVCFGSIGGVVPTNPTPFASSNGRIGGNTPIPPNADADTAADPLRAKSGAGNVRIDLGSWPSPAASMIFWNGVCGCGSKEGEDIAAPATAPAAVDVVDADADDIDGCVGSGGGYPCVCVIVCERGCE